MIGILSFIKAAALYNEIASDGLILRVEKGKLRGIGPKEAVDKWRARIVANKATLKKLINQNLGTKH